MASQDSWLETNIELIGMTKLPHPSPPCFLPPTIKHENNPAFSLTPFQVDICFSFAPFRSFVLKQANITKLYQELLTILYIWRRHCVDILPLLRVLINSWPPKRNITYIVNKQTIASTTRVSLNRLNQSKTFTNFLQFLYVKKFEKHTQQKSTAQKLSIECHILAILPETRKLAVT